MYSWWLPSPGNLREQSPVVAHCLRSCCIQRQSKQDTIPTCTSSCKLPLQASWLTHFYCFWDQRLGKQCKELCDRSLSEQILAPGSGKPETQREVVLLNLQLTHWVTCTTDSSWGTGRLSTGMRVSSLTLRDLLHCYLELVFWDFFIEGTDLSFYHFIQVNIQNVIFSLPLLLQAFLYHPIWWKLIMQTPTLNYLVWATIRCGC